MDSISYGYDDSLCSPEENQSISRRLNGDTKWARFLLGTPNSSNIGNEAPCPIPSPSPTPTPSPSPSPSPSNTPTPSPSPTPTPKPTFKPSPSPSPLLSPVLDIPSEGTVAGAATEINLSGYGTSPTPSPTVLGSKSNAPSLNQSRLKTVLFVGLGLIVISVAGFFGYRKYLSRKYLE